ncbi:hypothetical protein NQ317_012775 [Molorchus minor]|uniref:Uncharacterized protein n=1 Tax=Molorchus minor TaxID=1323400 RepID=A0ABQ9K4P0_9CUCU|nr:hypothetical protein NQ317_012775 [Molorchus minor]
MFKQCFLVQSTLGTKFVPTCNSRQRDVTCPKRILKRPIQRAVSGSSQVDVSRKTKNIIGYVDQR